MLEQQIAQANACVDEQAPELTKMADTIFDHPEIGPHEVFASKLLTDYLESHGFAVTRGVGGLETAFRAVWKNGEGGPNMGLLCEYDALPGMGHGCGHQMQGPGILGAAVAIQKAAGTRPFTLTVYGTPGEENISGKYIMIQNGCTFEELDVALMMHGGPATQTDIKCLANAEYDLIYHGKAAHAALKPEAGRSSLDAMCLAFHGMECLREHVTDDVRLHYNITDGGGTAANVVPSLTKAQVMVRANTVKAVKELMVRLEKIFQGAAMMTETTVEAKVGKILDNKIPNLQLNDVLMKYARELQAPNCQPPRQRTGSTDFANVMHRVPGSCIRVAFVPDGTSSHSPEFIAAGKSQEAHRAVVFGAKILADTVLELIDDPAELASIQKEFRDRLAAEEK
ncbi:MULTISPECIES: M20 family metallopeptidase [Acidaminococcus]|jgi:aminobenzoyl-glutamate utilization protein B|uniref:M20 family metallopeptidase n=1 Tax=Acidaminococcus TaxID=904 RepID=UPI00094EAEC2|nr:M20 family metallopeptidase [Acidaminococcus massiliensis]